MERRRPWRSASARARPGGALQSGTRISPQLQPHHLQRQAISRDTEELRGERLVAIGGVQSSLDRLALDCIDLRLEVGIHTFGSACGRARYTQGSEMVALQDRSVGARENGPRDLRLQLTHVPRPRMR